MHFVLAFALLLTACFDSDKTLQNKEYLGATPVNQFSLARLDYRLSSGFELKGRQQTTSRIEMATFPINDKKIDDIWRAHVDQIFKDQKSKGLPTETIKVEEISSGFPIIFYFANSTLPHRVTAEAYRLVGKDIFRLKFTGTTGKEEKIKYLFSMTFADYRNNVKNGFNIGAGAITGEASANEGATALLRDKKTQCELTLNTQTISSLSKGPMENIDEEIKELAEEGVGLEVIQKQSRTVGDLEGQEAIVSIDAPENNVLMLRYTWFYAGEVTNSFKPEIFIKMSCPKSEQKQVTKVWNNLIDSLKIRDQ